MKFVIVSPRQYAGGSLVLHRLCKQLEEIGWDASIFYKYSRLKYINSRFGFFISWIKSIFFDRIASLYIFLFPEKEKSQFYYMAYRNPPIKDTSTHYLPMVDDDTIVVYPEIVHGNPLHAKHVVRWLLYYPPFSKEDAWYSPTDLFFSYREQFNDLRLNPTGRILKIFHFDKELYKRTNYGNRSGVCYFIRKGETRSDLPMHFDGPILDHLKEPEKVRILNKCERCYIYDTQTFYASIAALCGCLPIVVVEPGKSRQDYIKPDDYVPGVAYGETEEEVRFAMRTQDEVRQEIQKLLDENEKNIKEFVSTCKAYFFPETAS